MNNFKVIRPVLPATNMSAELKFFDLLGFQSIYDSQRYYDKLDYAVLQRDGLEIHIQLQQQKDLPTSDKAQTIRILVNDLNAIEKELSDKGFQFERQDNTAWDTNEFRVHSPAHNAIIFQEDSK